MIFLPLPPTCNVAQQNNDRKEMVSNGGLPFASNARSFPRPRTQNSKVVDAGAQIDKSSHSSRPRYGRCPVLPVVSAAHGVRPS